MNAWNYPPLQLTLVVSDPSVLARESPSTPTEAKYLGALFSHVPASSFRPVSLVSCKAPENLTDNTSHNRALNMIGYKAHCFSGHTWSYDFGHQVNPQRTCTPTHTHASPTQLHPPTSNPTLSSTQHCTPHCTPCMEPQSFKFKVRNSAIDNSRSTVDLSNPATLKLGKLRPFSLCTCSPQTPNPPHLQASSPEP